MRNGCVGREVGRDRHTGKGGELRRQGSHTQPTGDHQRGISSALNPDQKDHSVAILPPLRLGVDGHLAHFWEPIVQAGFNLRDLPVHLGKRQ